MINTHTHTDVEAVQLQALRLSGVRGIYSLFIASLYFILLLILAAQL